MPDDGPGSDYPVYAAFTGIGGGALPTGKHFPFIGDYGADVVETSALVAKRYSNLGIGGEPTS